MGIRKKICEELKEGSWTVVPSGVFAVFMMIQVVLLLSEVFNTSDIIIMGAATTVGVVIFFAIWTVTLAIMDASTKRIIRWYEKTHELPFFLSSRK